MKSTTYRKNYMLKRASGNVEIHVVPLVECLLDTESRRAQFLGLHQLCDERRLVGPVGPSGYLKVPKENYRHNHSTEGAQLKLTSSCSSV